MVEDLRLGVIGIGKMGGIIVRSIADTVFPARQIWVTDLETTLVEQLCEEKRINAAEDIGTLVEKTDVILCAVTPPAIPHVLPQVARNLSTSQSLISIAAGVTTRTLESYFDTPPAVIRVMPNIAASVGASGISVNNR